MKFSLALALTAVAATSATKFGTREHSREHYEALFVDWMKTHDVQLSGEEFVERLNIFADAEDLINAHNAAGKSWKMAHNHFSHLTREEFREAAGLGVNIPEHIESRTGMNPLKLQKPAAKLRGNNVASPSSVDWVDSGAVTDVKDQGSCGSCWSFSTTGALEGAYYNKYGSLESFSEQMLVDCDTYDSGCNGGLMDYAFQWIQENGGLCAESDYSYTSGGGTSGTCQKSSCDVVEGSAPTSWTDVEANDAAMMEALAVGPVSIAIEADETNFQYYSSGVLTASCGTNLDHGVLAVGYGTMDGTDYYRVKNSWGSTWGDNGYIYLARGSDYNSGAGQCGMLSAASYPTL